MVALASVTLFGTAAAADSARSGKGLSRQSAAQVSTCMRRMMGQNRAITYYDARNACDPRVRLGKAAASPPMVADRIN